VRKNAVGRSEIEAHAKRAQGEVVHETKSGAFDPDQVSPELVFDPLLREPPGGFDSEVVIGAEVRDEHPPCPERAAPDVDQPVCVPKARGEEQRHLPGSDQIPLLGFTRVGSMSGEIFPEDGAVVAFPRRRNQADLETWERFGTSDQEGVPAFVPGRLTHRTV
jgi:hypothetical protein